MSNHALNGNREAIMDQEKLAEGRRLAAEKRRQATAEARAQEEKEEEELEKLRLDEQTILDFEKLRTQLSTFYNEINVLSKKSPDGPLNKFKIKFLNDTLRKITAILGPEHRPFPDFEAFDEAQLPTSSDAVLMLSHYMKSMDPFMQAHTYEDEKGRKRYWYTKGDDGDLEV
jgi:hypothetical protein